MKYYIIIDSHGKVKQKVDLIKSINKYFYIIFNMYLKL